MRYWEYVLCACDDNEVVEVGYEDGVREYLCDGYGFNDEASAIRWCQLANDCLGDTVVLPSEIAPARACPVGATLLLTQAAATEPEEEPVRQIVL